MMKDERTFQATSLRRVDWLNAMADSAQASVNTNKHENIYFQLSFNSEGPELEAHICSF